MNFADNDIITPSALKKGDLIRIVSPAGRVLEEEILPVIKWIEQQGFQVLYGKNVYADHFQFAGSDEQRLNDMQEAFDDPQCSAILCSRGGYGAVRIASKLNYSPLHRYPKWVIGFSDITIFHSQLNLQRIASLHAAMPRFRLKDEQNPGKNFQTMMKLLKGEKVTYSLPGLSHNRQGEAIGELVGGNLSILASLMGTPLELNTDGKILFIEDINEYLYRIDRMMHQFKLSGKLAGLNGLIVGSFTKIKDNRSPFGKNIKEIILEAVSGYDYPVIFDFPSGHGKKNLALSFGKKWRMTVSETGSSIVNAEHDNIHS